MFLEVYCNDHQFNHRWRKFSKIQIAFLSLVVLASMKSVQFKENNPFNASVKPLFASWIAAIKGSCRMWMSSVFFAAFLKETSVHSFRKSCFFNDHEAFSRIYFSFSGSSMANSWTLTKNSSLFSHLADGFWRSEPLRW